MSESGMERLVCLIGNRACITDFVMAEYIDQSPELAKWVRENCERHRYAQVWMLPVFEEPPHDR